MASVALHVRNKARTHRAVTDGAQTKGGGARSTFAVPNKKRGQKNRGRSRRNVSNRTDSAALVGGASGHATGAVNPTRDTRPAIAQWEQAQRETVRRQDADVVASVRGYDVMRWLRHGDESTMAVKAALFDVILGIDADGEKACVAIERHGAAERRRLVYLAAASALPNDVAGAWTAARLCALHI